MLRLALILPLLLTAPSAASSGRELSKIRIDGNNHWFKDEHGRICLFHGVNAVNKGFPWYPTYFLSDSRMDDFVDFGVNIIRLGTMWSGTEPIEGIYNGTYINILRDIVQRLADRGIYTMLDMHQDVMSSLYGTYDGIPLWLVEKFPDPTNPHPWPLDSINFWEENYLTQACSEGFQSFYDNYENAIGRWADFWGLIALNFRDLPGVIGYNLMNEPWIGDYFSNSNLTWSGVAGRENLLPAYDAVAAKIRENDQDGVIIYEPVIYGQLFDDDYTGSGFDRVPGGAEYSDHSVYSYHTYCWPLEFLAPNATDDDRYDAIETCMQELLPTIFRSQASNVEKTGGASILTEFGICNVDEETVNIRCDAYMDLADDFLQGWVDWDHNDGKWYDSDGQPRMNKIRAYMRTYARATAGIPLRMNYNSTTLDFLLEYEPDDDIEAPTEIYVSPYLYSDGYEVEVSEGLRWEQAGNLVLVFAQGVQAATVHITAVSTSDDRL